jgi:hypothetical protein
MKICGEEGTIQSGTVQITWRQSILGGYYYFRNPGFQGLFSLGHSVAGQTETYG